MDTGPYKRERGTGAVIQKIISENEMEYNGPFRWLYMSDPRVASAEKLRITVRLSVRW